MQPSSSEPEKDLSRDLKKFDRLPAKTKELVVLKDDAEKATGPEGVAVHQKILAKAGQGLPRPPDAGP